MLPLERGGGQGAVMDESSCLCCHGDTYKKKKQDKKTFLAKMEEREEGHGET